jgi:hypothetical protein
LNHLEKGVFCDYLILKSGPNSEGERKKVQMNIFRKFFFKPLLVHKDYAIPEEPKVSFHENLYLFSEFVNGLNGDSRNDIRTNDD